MRTTAASLTSALLVAKGQASALGYVAPGAGPIANIHTAPPPSKAKAQPKRWATARGAANGTNHPERVKLSLRLDGDRHLRLKLLSAHLRKSSQEILVSALDSYLANSSQEVERRHCACLCAKDEVSAGDRSEPAAAIGPGPCPYILNE